MNKLWNFTKLLMVNILKIVLLLLGHIGLILYVIVGAILELIKAIGVGVYTLVVTYFKGIKQFNMDLMDLIKHDIFREKA